MLKRLLFAGLILAFSAAPALAADPIRPDASITPGDTRSVTTKQICVPGSASAARAVLQNEKQQAYDNYGLTPQPGGYEVDHLISLELGGSNDIKNLWPQTYHGTWNAHVKDHLENVLHKMVCNGDISLATAQKAIRTDWIAAYKKYVSATPPAAK